MNTPRHPNFPGITRRSFLAETGMAFTGLVLGSMLFRDGVRAEKHFARAAENLVLALLNHNDFVTVR